MHPAPGWIPDTAPCCHNFTNARQHLIDAGDNILKSPAFRMHDAVLQGPQPERINSGDDADPGPSAKRPRLGQAPSDRMQIEPSRLNTHRDFELPQLEALVQNIDFDQSLIYEVAAEDAAGMHLCLI